MQLDRSNSLSFISASLAFATAVPPSASKRLALLDPTDADAAIGVDLEGDGLPFPELFGLVAQDRRISEKPKISEVVDATTNLPVAASPSLFVTAPPLLRCGFVILTTVTTLASGLTEEPRRRLIFVSTSCISSASSMQHKTLLLIWSH